MNRCLWWATTTTTVGIVELTVKWMMLQENFDKTEKLIEVGLLNGYSALQKEQISTQRV